MRVKPIEYEQPFIPPQYVVYLDGEPDFDLEATVIDELPGPIGTSVTIDDHGKFSWHSDPEKLRHDMGNKLVTVRKFQRTRKRGRHWRDRKGFLKFKGYIESMDDNAFAGSNGPSLIARDGWFSMADRMAVGSLAGSLAAGKVLSMVSGQGMSYPIMSETDGGSVTVTFATTTLDWLPKHPGETESWITIDPALFSLRRPIPVEWSGVAVAQIVANAIQMGDPHLIPVLQYADNYHGKSYVTVVGKKIGSDVRKIILDPIGNVSGGLGMVESFSGVTSWSNVRNRIKVYGGPIENRGTYELTPCWSDEEEQMARIYTGMLNWNNYRHVGRLFRLPDGFVPAAASSFEVGGGSENLTGRLFDSVRVWELNGEVETESDQWVESSEMYEFVRARAENKGDSIRTRRDVLMDGAAGYADYVYFDVPQFAVNSDGGWSRKRVAVQAIKTAGSLFVDTGLNPSVLIRERELCLVEPSFLKVIFDTVYDTAGTTGLRKHLNTSRHVRRDDTGAMAAYAGLMMAQHNQEERNHSMVLNYLDDSWTVGVTAEEVEDTNGSRIRSGLGLFVNRATHSISDSMTSVSFSPYAGVTLGMVAGGY